MAVDECVRRGRPVASPCSVRQPGHHFVAARLPPRKGGQQVRVVVLLNRAGRTHELRRALTGTAAAARRPQRRVIAAGVAGVHGQRTRADRPRAGAHTRSDNGRDQHHYGHPLQHLSWYY